ncbi:ubiquinol-cytochrome c reductase iron-sulfur subunit [Pseudaminobacter salicylatoxidans]|uniref:ubiquinol-cytochrome c reductase iron-sulfur subunit n=1 Tax=Pseudaminobacter salicylatoxidans TaxID=93369 RepID=UPI0002EE5477|nr:ubiquinol-cytochrome c reductase iron-sulfur subunit [Pseudaminobacter salicylatoxidans]
MSVNFVADPPRSARPPVTRRDFLYIATGSFAVVGTAAALWPMIDQMRPDEGVLASGGPVEVDVSKIGPGEQITVRWRGRPVFIINRAADALKELKNPSLLARLRDPDSQVPQQPPYARNWSRSSNPQYAVLVGVCTHLGCIPEFQPAADPQRAWPGGYFCPCHGSKYDLAGRVFKNVPAPYNLPVPPYHFTSATMLKIGENPPGVSFDFSSIQQI